jgi:hypothetical protein
MSNPNPEEGVGLPPTFKENLKSILSHAASNDVTVIEFRTTTLEDGDRYLTHAVDISEYVSELERRVDEVPDAPPASSRHNSGDGA